MHNTPALLVSIAAALIALYAVYLNYCTKRERVESELHQVRKEVEEEIARQFASRRTNSIHMNLIKSVWLDAGRDPNHPTLKVYEQALKDYDAEYLALEETKKEVDQLFKSNFRPEAKLKALRENIHASLVRLVRESEGVEKHTAQTLDMLRSKLAVKQS